MKTETWTLRSGSPGQGGEHVLVKYGPYLPVKYGDSVRPRRAAKGVFALFKHCLKFYRRKSIFRTFWCVYPADGLRTLRVSAASIQFSIIIIKFSYQIL